MNTPAINHDRTCSNCNSVEPLTDGKHMIANTYLCMHMEMLPCQSCDPSAKHGCSISRVHVVWYLYRFANTALQQAECFVTFMPGLLTCFLIGDQTVMPAQSMACISTLIHAYKDWHLGEYQPDYGFAETGLHLTGHVDMLKNACSRVCRQMHVSLPSCPAC